MAIRAPDGANKKNSKMSQVEYILRPLYWEYIWRQNKVRVSIVLLREQYKKIYKSWVYIGAVIYAAHGSIQSLAEPQWPKRGLRDSLRAPSSSSLVLPTFGQILRSKEVPDLPEREWSNNDIWILSLRSVAMVQFVTWWLPMSLIQCIIKIREGLRVKQVDGKEVIKIQGVPE